MVQLSNLAGPEFSCGVSVMQASLCTDALLGVQVIMQVERKLKAGMQDLKVRNGEVVHAGGLVRTHAGVHIRALQVLTELTLSRSMMQLQKGPGYSGTVPHSG